MKTLLGLLLVIAIGIGGFYAFNEYIYDQKQQVVAMDYKNTEFIIEGKRVKLDNGRAEIATVPEGQGTIIAYFGNEARGDMNRDGIEDVAFLVTSDGGGTGTFYYVGVALQSAELQYYGTNMILLGDRIHPQTTEFRDGQLIVNYGARKATDAMTDEPTVGVSRYFVVETGTLREINSGTKWILNDTGETTDSDAPMTAVELQIDEEKRTVGTYEGSCFVIEESEWKLYEGEISGVICWWAGGGTEIGIFEENGVRVVKVGTIEEGSPEEPGIRGNFETLFAL